MEYYNDIVEGVDSMNYMKQILLLLFILSVPVCIIYPSLLGNLYIFISFILAFVVGAYLYKHGHDFII